MHHITLIGLVVVAAAFPVALALSASSTVARTFAMVFALGFAAFCAFGFLASFEHSGLAGLPWKLGYGIAGLGSLVGTLMIVRSSRSREKPIG